MEFLYKSKTYWAHCFTSFKFAGGMIASSHVESVNACLKHQCLQKFLTPTMLKMHRDEINQSLYYTANLVENADEEYPTTTSLGEILNVNLPQTTLK
ncbi:unnamed protein product [Rhizophagus irregularis]|nr:unnamed protein product [Rhizophagus irregularis]